MATYMEAVNISLPNAALPHIQGTLSMANDEVGWVFTAYMAAGAAVMPTARWLAGRYGRKTVYQVALAVFVVGLILNTLATTSLQFVFARIVQGAASGTLAPLSLATLLVVLPQPRHARITLAWSVCIVLGISSGASIGGWLSECYGSHSIFYFSLPTGFIFLVMALSLGEERAERKLPFDSSGWRPSPPRHDRPANAARPQRTPGMVCLEEIWAEAIASVLDSIFHRARLTTKVHFSARRCSRTAISCSTIVSLPSASSCCRPWLTSPMLRNCSIIQSTPPAS
jgi:DHA2 family multidrug resistance protein